MLLGHTPRPRNRPSSSIRHRALPGLLVVLVAALVPAVLPGAGGPASAAGLPSVITLTGPPKVVDEQVITFTITWRTADNRPVPGSVALQQKVDGRWRTRSNHETNLEGYLRVRLRPRTDSRWRAVGRANTLAAKAFSSAHHVDNVPPGRAVNLPERAPRPRISPRKQSRAQGAGAHPVISGISSSTWRSMVGRSWHRGCPVGRAGLRLLRINYWDYAGYRRRGELVAAASVVRQMSAALADMYAAKLPIRSMIRVDRFGWSRHMQGGNDNASMAAGNTSAFNCRWVNGRPGVRSPHSYGRALDLNTWENPYHASYGWTPDGWWRGHSHQRVAWRSRSHQVVRIMRAHGLRWTYGNADSQHFDAAPRGGRAVVVQGCGAGVVCD